MTVIGTLTECRRHLARRKRKHPAAPLITNLIEASKKYPRATDDQRKGNRKIHGEDDAGHRESGARAVSGPRLSLGTVHYSPPFEVGDWVVRRPGTLGNMDGTASSGRVQEIFDNHGHTMATVKFLNRTETFIADIYQKATP